jgi:hypothetical protein
MIAKKLSAFLFVVSVFFLMTSTSALAAQSRTSYMNKVMKCAVGNSRFTVHPDDIRKLKKFFKRRSATRVKVRFLTKKVRGSKSKIKRAFRKRAKSLYVIRNRKSKKKFKVQVRLKKKSSQCRKLKRWQKVR